MTWAFKREFDITILTSIFILSSHRRHKKIYRHKRSWHQVSLEKEICLFRLYEAEIFDECQIRIDTPRDNKRDKKKKRRVWRLEDRRGTFTWFILTNGQHLPNVIPTSSRGHQTPGNRDAIEIPNQIKIVMTRALSRSWNCASSKRGLISLFFPEDLINVGSPRV